MPQARLPDINAAFTKHRNEVIASLKSGNYDAVFGSLYALNALLPDTTKEDGSLKYRVAISDIDYKKLTKTRISVECPNQDCKELLQMENIKIFDKAITGIDAIISGHKKLKAWKCPKCGKTHVLKPDQVIASQVKEPFFIGVVPKPPHRRYGVSDRAFYHRKIKQWALNFLDELEAKMAQFRDDNWTKNDQMREQGFETEDSGEGEESEAKE